MAVVGVAEAAEELGVSPRRVRQMLADGQLRGERLGRAWVVDRAVLDRAAVIPSQVGRPWRAEAAWALLALAEGQDPDLSAVDRVRIGRRLDQGIEAHVGRLGSRAEERRFYGHPSVVPRILQRSGVVRSGVSAVDDHDIDLVSLGQAELYIRKSDLLDVVEQYALDDSSDRPNMILRVVDDDIWPFEPDQSVASAAVVAVDLLSSVDGRCRRAGQQLLGRS
ncbi:MAG: helix-turn-helix domain-containing protein [Acidimicrobiia bacterium]|nr:helix-turn-helix domain-containing protein [Acidimicrobiia bacterium]